MSEMTVMIRRHVGFLVVMVLILSASLPFGNLVFANPEGASLDLYTQKQPYSGMGTNATSDAFGPGEEVQIFALATYNGYPVQQLPVAFGIFGPPNSVSNVTFTNSAITDQNGIANISFRISYDPDTMFGNWTVLGNARIADTTAQDLLFFRVGWIVQITSVTTIDTNHVPQQNFTQESFVGIELQLKNIAFVEKTAAIFLAVNDSMGIRINATEITNVIVPPNETVLTEDAFIYIPASAHIGRATITASVLTAPVEQNGVPYSPEVLAYFNIIVRDIGIVSVTPDVLHVYTGQQVHIDVVVRNTGMQTETFDTRAYYNGTLLGTVTVTDLAPSSQMTIRLTWDTSNVTTGTYQISASAGPVPGEINLSDNTLNDGYVEIIPIIHDVAVLNAVSSSYSAVQGDIIDVTVTATNLGTVAEAFNVTAFYNSTAISSPLIVNLQPQQQQLLVFEWNTTELAVGNYTLSAQASQVAGETNLANNQFEDGTVEINRPPEHDIAVVSVTPSSNLVFIGQTVHVTVVVSNVGSNPESFNVTAFRDSTEIGTQQVTNLGPRTNLSLDFAWNTVNVPSGNYHISASATTVPGEVNIANNVYDDGVVQVVPAPGAIWFGLEWWQLLLLLLLILLIIILILFVYRRRKKEDQSDTSFKTGFVAWYYKRGMN